jgi:2-amino-4-hydroxy-6-hydroxymethyldihydropteridine diphosphokinase
LSAAGGELHRAWLSLGSNIEPERNLPASVALLRQHVQVLALSSTWETDPVGSSGPNFLNAAVEIATPLERAALKNEVIQAIETRLGRVRTADKYAPRPIDLDILIFDDETVEPAIWTRLFLAAPLSELLPGYTQDSCPENLAHAAQRLLAAAPAHRRQDVKLE